MKDRHPRTFLRDRKIGIFDLFGSAVFIDNLLLLSLYKLDKGRRRRVEKPLIWGK